jgi:1-deoxy-D-xylulose-5-phosphate reductoisomerase
MGNNMKQITVLGSTGSIGQQTLDVVRALPDKFRIIALAGGANIELLTKQIEEFKPKFVYHLSSGSRGSKELKSVTKTGCQFMSMEDIASHPEVDIVVMATSGKSGLSPTLAAIKAGKKIALSNKEVLVMAGEIVTDEARRHGAQIFSVDSEHSAIWQCLVGESKKIVRLILTASGGPFRQYSKSQLKEVTVEQALNHPSWRMGKKVTIDSATLMNKGLEVIEAHWLFNMAYDKIEVIIHPQSIIHSMVEFVDGSIKAQLSYPDMRLPIQYALSYPERLANPQLPKLDWSRIASLNFAQPDFDTFPCLKLAMEAGRKGGTYPAVLCGADEVAVELFLSRRIKFTDIAKLVEQALEQHKARASPSLEEIIEADTWAREKVRQLAGGGKPC